MECNYGKGGSKIMNKVESSSGENLVYAVVRNIPKNFRSKHLRQFFSTFVEEQRFHCFHYLHCPEIIQAEQFCKADDASSKAEGSFNNKNCALVLMTLSDRDLFIRRYHGKDWALHSEFNVDGKCCIVKCKDPRSFLLSSEQNNATKGKSHLVLRQLKPPALLPNGNVGTPTSVILNFIKQCKFPSHMIRKLGIYDRTSINQRSGVEIPFAYETQPVEASEYSTSFFRELSDEEEDDDDQCEEWERHEAFHDDPGKQDRLKETLYEEEMEIVWEKGGPGLVFNTDAFQRSQAENDTDEKWADQWDIDMSAYYAEGREEYDSADKDAKDSLEIRRMAMIQSGQLSDSVFKKPNQKETVNSNRNKNSKKSAIEESLDRMKESEFGAFEKYTKGIGLKLLRKQGWKEGSGLGKTGQGSALPVALEMLENAQAGKEKAGFAYRGENRDFAILYLVFDNGNVRVCRFESSLIRKIIIARISLYLLVNNAKNFYHRNETFLTSAGRIFSTRIYRRLFSASHQVELPSGKCFLFFERRNLYPDKRSTPPPSVGARRYTLNCCAIFYVKRDIQDSLCVIFNFTWQIVLLLTTTTHRHSFNVRLQQNIRSTSASVGRLQLISWLTKSLSHASLFGREAGGSFLTGFTEPSWLPIDSFRFVDRRWALVRTSKAPSNLTRSLPLLDFVVLSQMQFEKFTKLVVNLDVVDSEPSIQAFECTTACQWLLNT
ncbi:G patch domain-containing protein 3 [Trichinella pseudospiralis]|uniref:G patch domain-containing protein 3 n=1 Tax=Trichinella pseudospiralis TaxID=6337 RepID=A0A0V1J1V7_TRIPS|nr:G patch domain-containing protein 3 [Trichinella pseudospiralis]